MPTYPTTPRAEFVEWCDAHVVVFLKHAETIGFSPQQAPAFDAATANAHAALLEQEQARQAMFVATRKARAAIRTLRENAGSAVRTIRAHAETTPSPAAIYATAQIPPPAANSPAQPPTAPTRLGATLDATTGALRLRWKARQPAGTSGTTYLIRRRLPGETAFAFVGVSGKKTFVDDSLPAGVENVQYTVQPQRGDRGGPLGAVLTVNFGKRQNVEKSKSQHGANGERSGAMSELRRAKSESAAVTDAGRWARK